MKVKLKSPIRTAVADQSTYYDNKGSAIKALDQALAYFQFRTKCCQLPDNDGSTLIPAVDMNCEDEDTAEDKFYVYTAWYRMPSGRYEFTFYVT